MDRTSLSSKPRAVVITVKGRVQGVGFRPFIFRLAKRHQIKGTVQNNMDGVKIHGEGSESALTHFTTAIKNEAPRLSRLDEVVVDEATYIGYSQFEIIPSEREGKSSLVIPVDSAVCPECIEEMMDRNNFRYRYPFINCTQCGPRYTIIDALPYDRPFTVMKDFEMCPKCKAEYEDPLNRRHHAQPIACDDCGPKVTLHSISGQQIAEKDEAILETIRLLRDGKIVAIKGIGGYHLACDAYNDEAVSSLRKRKNRPERPLAVMASSIEKVEEICHVLERERIALLSPESPIVILKKRDGARLSKGLAPGMSTLGVMLPYTPLHQLLFAENDLKVIVMTSANPSGLPMLYEEKKAFTYLESIADYILTNNREILHPVDDSVVQIINGKQTFLRRARGYVPDPLETNEPVHSIVALGSQQKNTFALGRHNQIFIGPHIGELEHLEVIDHFEKEFHHLMKWMGNEGEMVAVDLHPSYATNEIAEKMKKSLIHVQHHHAHLASCLEDNQLSEPAFGIILDGTGYGEDGHIWGFEFLYGDKCEYQRLGHLKYTPLPGNEKAIKEPWRNAVGMLVEYFGLEGKTLAKEIFRERAMEIDVLANMIDKKVNSPLAGTCGRLFDAVSAIVGICEKATYDGEAAIKLSEQMTSEAGLIPYPYEILVGENELLEIDFSEALFHIVKERLRKIPTKEIVQRFHETIVNICVEMMMKIKEKHPYSRNVVLSGGSFHNPYLTREISLRLQELGFRIFTHQRVPCNDGGLSLGQLVIAAKRASLK